MEIHLQGAKVKTIAQLPKRLRFFRERVWLVKFEDSALNLSFDSRQEARTYKKLLANSNRKLEGQIISREILDKYIVDEVVT